MANDIFTGALGGSTINWSDAAAWSSGLPTSSTVAEVTGGAKDTTISSIAGLKLDSGAGLTVGTNLTVTGAGDAAFGGANSTITVLKGFQLTAGAAMTSATGTVIIDAGTYEYDGSGATQTVEVDSLPLTGGKFTLGGSNNNDTITLNAAQSAVAAQGTDNGGIAHLNGGAWYESGTNDTTTIDMSHGGLFLTGTPFSGVIDGFGLGGSLQIDALNSGETTTTYSTDLADHTMTFHFSDTLGTITLHFDSSSDITHVQVDQNSGFFSVVPTDFFSGASGGGSNTWSTLADWSEGVAPSQATIVEVGGAGTMNLAGTQIGGLILDSGAVLSIPSGSTLTIDGFVPVSGAGAFNLSPGGKLVVEGQTSPLSYSISGNTITLNYAAHGDIPGSSFILNFVSTAGIHVSVGGTFSITATVCYCTGTLIRTTRGEVAVEDLEVGDLAITVSGEARPIVWIGHRKVAHPAREAWPVRIAADAFGEGVPEWDTWLSPGHAVCVDEMFIPIEKLINGATITRQEVSSVTYWHVELESHDVLLAHGLPAESYMDAGNRAFFGKAYGRLREVDPQRLEESFYRYARRFVTEGPEVDDIHQRLVDRAEALGWRGASAMDLHLRVDGVRIEPTSIGGDRASFIVPSGAGSVRLCSSAFQPADQQPCGDHRRLGTKIFALSIQGAQGLEREISLDEIDGFHPGEAAAGVPWRWTTGDLPLPAHLFAHSHGPAILRLTFEPRGLWRWMAPDRGAYRAA